MKISLIIDYLGPLPFWMPAFLLSCKYNPGIDWLIFTDQPAPEQKPDNVHFHHWSLDTLNQLAAEKLQTKINVPPDKPQKLCDLRPAYGKLFEDYLHEYDFWGHCDIDVIWGDIESHITKHMLDRFDIITARYKWLTGSFTLYRNMRHINELYQSNLLFNYIASRKHHYNMDEYYMTKFLRRINSKLALARLITRLQKKSLNGKYRIYWEKVLMTSGKHQKALLADNNWSMMWSGGRTFGVNGEEFMYLHFHKIKSLMHSIDFNYNNAPQSFLINKDGFHQNLPRS